MKLGFLASGSGTNMQAIVDACRDGRLPAEPVAVVGNNSRSQALERARRQGIPAFHLSSRTHPDPDALDAAIASVLSNCGAGILCLAGYMKLLGPRTLRAFEGRVLNIHPALLPKYGGRGFYGRAVHEAVLASADTESGATVHLVDDLYDHGPVLARAWVPVLPGDTPDTLAARVLEQEHLLFTDTLRRIASGEINLPEAGAPAPA